MIVEYLLVFLGAAIPWFEIALVIPFGIITGLNPVAVIVIAFIGNMVTLLALIFGLVQRLEEKKKKRRKSKNFVEQIWLTRNGNAWPYLYRLSHCRIYWDVIRCYKTRHPSMVYN